ncbi:hypothetical protein PRNP1_014068 [Phytophthora ramorum]
MKTIASLIKKSKTECESLTYVVSVIAQKVVHGLEKVEMCSGCQDAMRRPKLVALADADSRRRGSLAPSSNQLREEQKILEIDVKPGWKDDTKVTFEGQDDALPGRPAQDIVFVIKQKPHNNGTLTIKTLDGREVPVPLGGVVAPGTRMVIAGEGMPLQKRPSQRGNLVVEFDVQFPTKLTEAQKNMVRQVL